MKLDLSQEIDTLKAKSRLEFLIKKGAKIELKEIREKRTNDQNKYIHVLFGLFGSDKGYTLEESKSLMKRNCKMLHYEKNGKTFAKSTARLDTKQMTDFIEWVRNYSNDHGCYLPSPDEYYQNKFYYEREIEKDNIYQTN